MNILFVCTGNTCRSPMAEALFREKGKGADFHIRSAGVAAYDGQKASEHVRHILGGRGIEHDHHAKRLDADLLAWADLVLTMTTGHKMLVLDRFPDAASKVFALKEYTSGLEQDIADPFGGSLTLYHMCADEIEQELSKLHEKLLTNTPE